MYADRLSSLTDVSCLTAEERSLLEGLSAEELETLLPVRPAGSQPERDGVPTFHVVF